MEFNPDRVAELAGISVSRRKASGVLSEARQIVGVDNTEIDLDPVTEARLRKAIRAELKSVLREVMQEQEESFASDARHTKSVSQALGFSKAPRKNRASAQAGRAIAFGGPGFM